MAARATPAPSTPQRTQAAPEAIKAILFDKDGTLIDFQGTWGPFGVRVIDQLSAGEPGLTRALAGAIGLDMATATYHRDSPVIADSSVTVAERLLAHLPDWNRHELISWLDSEAQSVGPSAQIAASADLVGLLEQLSIAGYALGVATNDSKRSAELQLAASGADAHITFVAGYDSVAQPKPAPDMVLAFGAEIGAPMSAIAMVGDSLHDLAAARAAQAGAAIGVLTGVATAETLAPAADVVLPSIDALPAWLRGEAT